ncbi:MAG: type II toxin-antitoxin system RelE/ParE family toxin [Sideroxydans sp.]|nr:type II toxin-antitoxin system RelE/ParE family toxin [Sideroxydans sp.]
MRAKKRLEFSEDALIDTADISHFYAVERGNVRAAKKVEITIFKAAENLEFTPELGKHGSIKGTRELVITAYPYTIIYKLTPSKVIVLNVIHQSRQHP